MPYTRLTAIVLLPAAVAWLTAASRGEAQQPTPPSQTTAPTKQPAAQPGSPAQGKPAPTPQGPPPPKADPEAVKTFKRLAEGLDPKKLGYLETAFRESVQSSNFSFAAQGTYRSGPHHELRLDLKTEILGQPGDLQFVSDGVTVWKAIRLNSGRRAVSKWDVKDR